jgi:hypothetical protein
MEIRQHVPLLQTKTNENHSANIKEELITTAWHPDRYETWCLDQQTKKEIKEDF